MLFAIVCRDGKDSAQLRERHLPQHLAHVEANLGRFRVAGPLNDEDGATVGSVLIIEADDAADARAFLKADPYFAVGVWSQWTVELFLAVAGTWVGGAAWKGAAWR